MFFRRKQSKLQRGIFVTITVLIAIGLVIPLAGLFQKQPDNGATQDLGQAGASLQEKLTDLETRAKAAPNDKEVLMELAVTYLYSSAPEKAVQTYEQVLALDPASSDARINLATIYYYSSKYDEAVAQLQETIQRDPENSFAHYLYGIVLGDGKKDYAGGIQELEKFIAMAKEGPEVEKAKLTIEEWKAAPAQKP